MLEFWGSNWDVLGGLGRSLTTELLSAEAGCSQFPTLMLHVQLDRLRSFGSTCCPGFANMAYGQSYSLNNHLFQHQQLMLYNQQLMLYNSIASLETCM
jgi:hypothetical protein